MSEQPSKMVTDRQKSSNIVQATRTQLDLVADAFVAGFPEAVRPEAKRAVALIVNQLVDGLASATASMVGADAANARELADDGGLLARRDALAAEVAGVIGRLRDVVRAYFSEDTLRLLAVPSVLPTDPVVLHRTGLAVLEQLRTFEAPQPQLPSMKFVHAEWRALLTQPVTDLGAAIEAVAVDRRENQLTLVEKNRAIEAYDAAFRATTHFLMGLFVAAGHDELASRVKPSSRRPGRTDEEERAPSPEPEPAAS